MSMIATQASALYEYEEINGICYSISFADMTAEVSAFDAISGKYYSGNIVIPDSIVFEGKTFIVNSIGPSAFSGDHIESVSIPETVTQIEEQAFSFCVDLTSITIPNGVTYIGFYAFECSGLVSLTIGDDVTLIDNKAFSSCNRLTTVTIGEKVKKIGKKAFEECRAITQLTCKATTPPSCETDALSDINKDKCRLIVPKDCSFAYQHAIQWMDFNHISEEYTAIQNVSMDHQDSIDMFINLNGFRTQSPQKGINIVRIADGATRKVVQR